MAEILSTSRETGDQRARPAPVPSEAVDLDGPAPRRERSTPRFGIPPLLVALGVGVVSGSVGTMLPP